jgi:hypothetical protein
LFPPSHRQPNAHFIAHKHQTPKNPEIKNLSSGATFAAGYYMGDFGDLALGICDFSAPPAISSRRTSSV